MTQAQLLTKGGSKLDGDVAPKPLRITVPHFDNSALIQGYAKTLIGKCMNPSEQDVKALIIMMPKIWKVEDKVVGTDLGLGRFQFDFDREEDIDEVLRMQPYHFDYWMISLVRWKPVAERNFPTEITFWVRVLEVPLQFWAEPTFESIGEALGKVVEVDPDYGRVKVIIDGSKGSEKEPEKGSDVREERNGTYGNRAVSYKGVIINGKDDRKEQEEDGRDHQGKGKGKMFEEDDVNWVRVERRGNRRPMLDRNRFRRGDREVRSSHPRQELPRYVLQEGRYHGSGFRGTRRERSPRDSHHYHEKSMGRTYEATRSAHSAESGVSKQDLISQEVRQEFRASDKDCSKQVVMEKEGIEDEVNDLASFLVTGHDMETEGGHNIAVVNVESKIDESGFQDLTDEDNVENQGEEVVNMGTRVAENDDFKENAKDESTAMVERNTGYKKKATKGVPFLGGSTKQKMMQIANKRPPSKVNSKQGNGVKQGTEQGPSHPTLSSFKF
ncbi:hypothetical protein N665_0784s0004 [Sinapis alba]|nr:hypothetical protein N665_0784s0004 [Sinapis alba]